MHCVPFALSLITGEDFAVINSMMLRYPEWVQTTSDGVVNFAKPAAALSVPLDLGYRVSELESSLGPATVGEWVRLTAMPRFRNHVLLLHTETHAAVAVCGRVFDNQRPESPPGAEHPYTDEPVRLVYSVEVPASCR
jgi:hypothetical protein